MTKPIVMSALTLALTLTISGPAQAELPLGARAPGFATQGAVAGKSFAYNLRQALRKGPVVLYFYPKSFTQGCTLEARAFSEAIDDFKAAGASVIGLSADDMATQIRFSSEECRGKFPVAIATPEIIRAYDVALVKPDGSATGLTKRTSYVIARDGRVRLVHSNMDYRDHVKLTLEAVRALKAAKKR
jgi:peroxiredoxin